ncbi:unnamed protein product [Microthlaspi erraticum]|uniref:Uncharacterized protein n=1 Tax=Microthlaspi erraticum TaxID=1685480 RepID=A0A6D2JRX7_9BRAS|nr:unnamed protein product [Microthlaspi erraticum]
MYKHASTLNVLKSTFKKRLSFKITKMKKVLGVVFFLMVYLTQSMGLVPYQGCNEVEEKKLESGLTGEASRDDSGTYGQKRVSKEDFSSGRKLVSGPSRSACGH